MAKATSKGNAGRKEIAPAAKLGPEFIGKTPGDEAQGFEAMRDRQLQLVEQFGDGLPWHPDHYEAAIRSEFRRGCEAFLRAGSYLVVARECTVHGEWLGMLDRLGLGPDTAQRMMAAARRMAELPNAATSRHLIEATNTQGKLIELLSLPEDQFAELADKGATGDLTLDDVGNMTVRELRAAVREARADVGAKDERIAKLSGDLEKEHDKLAKAQRKWKTATADERQVTLEQAVIAAEESIKAQIRHPKDGLQAVIGALAEHCGANDLDCTEFLGDVFGRLLNAVREARDDETVAEHGIAIPVVGDGEG